MSGYEAVLSIANTLLSQEAIKKGPQSSRNESSRTLQNLSVSTGVYQKGSHQVGASQPPGTAGVLEDIFMNIIYYTLAYPLMMMTQGHETKVFTVYLIFDKAEQLWYIQK